MEDRDVHEDQYMALNDILDLIFVYYISAFALFSSIYGKKSKGNAFTSEQIKMLVDTFTISAENNDITFSEEEELMMDYVAQQEQNKDMLIRPTFEIFNFICYQSIPLNCFIFIRGSYLVRHFCFTIKFKKFCKKCVILVIAHLHISCQTKLFNFFT